MRYVVGNPPKSSSTTKGNLVLIHGFGGNADHWRRNVEPLAAAGFKVFAIDLLGYGYSSKINPNEAKKMKGLNGENGR